ncbi:MAG: carboxy-S-adenosyl-L-methionine synthase CmoA [Kangiellaceae bacterium]|nr:carboxy-S-adenosyl-L-methionine synthase CmoA [Kangiellaceae bacterium]
MIRNSDNIYSQSQDSAPFRFDKKVATVFTDMIKRSVPGYAEIIVNIQQLATIYSQVNSNCYDLGCSLGAASLAMSHGNSATGVQIIGVDNSLDMLEQCGNNIAGFVHKTPISLVQANIQQTEITNASIVVLNYTLQFVQQEERKQIIKKIFDGLLPGGILILSEKIIYSDPTVNQLMIELHHQFKRNNGYSELEISQKRSALENVLIPELLEIHISRMKSVGFKHVDCFQQQLNFASLIAIK